MCRSRQQVHGFTLIEVLIAVAVFGLMATMAYSGLSNSLNISHEAKARSEQLHRLQMAMALMQRDFTQLISQPIRDGFGDTQPALYTDLKGERLLEFSRIGWRNPANQIRSTTQRVGYRLEENRLYRQYWPHFYRGPDEKPLETVLLDEVAEIRFEFLDQAQQWQQQWPPVNSPATIMPLAVKITVIPQDRNQDSSSGDEDNKFERYFEIPVG
ncbi:MAG TPA: type II secretion system minor pseudopilin GspJ [Gammaproteobacteria bacterium]